MKEVLPGFNSKKVLKQVCEVNKAKVQGAKENIRRIKQMSQVGGFWCAEWWNKEPD